MEEKELQQYKHFFFDMDGTLTESRTEIVKYNKDLLERIKMLDKDVAVISGATIQQIYKQIPFLPDVDIYAMGQSGNDVRLKNEEVWQNGLEPKDIIKTLYHIHDVMVLFNGTQYILPDRLEVRGGQVSYSFIGHNADKELKRAFDPDGKKRRHYLEKVPFNYDDLMVKIGGTTCLDYTKKGLGKKGNLLHLIEQNNWSVDDCVYIGDQLYEGGNDEDMIGVMKTISVKDPADCRGKMLDLVYVNKT